MYNYHNKGSYGERKVDKILTDAHIKFYREFEYGGMIGPSGYPMRFDFYLPNKRIAIEVDGSQHYMVIGGNTEQADYQFKCDKLKNAYCLKANIKLYRVPTWELDNIYCFEQLTNDRFLVKDADYAKNIVVPNAVKMAMALKEMGYDRSKITCPSNIHEVLRMDRPRPQCEPKIEQKTEQKSEFPTVIKPKYDTTYYYSCRKCGQSIRRKDVPYCYNCEEKMSNQVPRPQCEPKIEQKTKRPQYYCLHCGRPIAGNRPSYCSNRCLKKAVRKRAWEGWWIGPLIGLSCLVGGTLPFIILYFIIRSLF